MRNRIKIIAFSLVVFSLPVFAAPESATFAGGCFWTMQYDFNSIPGVIATTVGYTGGKVVNPSYDQVETGDTGHREAILITYDPEKVSYATLLSVFWHNIDPTDNEGQFCDKGSQYRAAIFYHNTEQKKIAFSSKQTLIDSKRFSKVVTEILPATTFYPAESYHQNFYKTHSLQYGLYKHGCGRIPALKDLWGK